MAPASRTCHAPAVRRATPMQVTTTPVQVTTTPGRVTTTPVLAPATSSDAMSLAWFSRIVAGVVPSVAIRRCARPSRPSHRSHVCP